MPGSFGGAGAEGAFAPLASRLTAAVPFPSCRRVMPSLCSLAFTLPKRICIRRVKYRREDRRDWIGLYGRGTFERLCENNRRERGGSVRGRVKEFHWRSQPGRRKPCTRTCYV